MLKILFIGGTEFFGKILVEKLLAAGHEVTLLTRGNKKPAFWDNISHIQCDRKNYAEFENKLMGKEFDTVIDNTVSDEKDIESIVQVFGSRQNPPHYVFCSSTAVYPRQEKPDNKEILEDTADLTIEDTGDWKADYANGKRKAEKYLVLKRGKMPYTIFRSTVIEGSGDPHKRTWFWVQRIKDGFPIIIPEENKSTLYRHVSPEDVAQAFLLAVGNKKSYNQVYNVAGEKALTVEEYLGELASALGKNKPVLCWIPEENLRKEFPDYELPPFFDRYNFALSIKKIWEELGYRPQKTSAWIKTTVDSLKNENSPSWGYEKREKEKKISGAFKENDMKKEEGVAATYASFRK